MLAAVDRKVAGQEIVVAERAEEPEPIIDLMAALKRSIEARHASEGAAGAAGAERVRKPAVAKGKSKAPGKGSKRATR